MLALFLASGCEPSKEEYIYINARDLLELSHTKKVPNPITIHNVNIACKEAQKDRERFRAARKLAEECDPLPEVWYYQKALAAFPEALAGSPDLAKDLWWACKCANSSLSLATQPKGTPRDRDRLPSARALAEECDRSLDKLPK